MTYYYYTFLLTEPTYTSTYSEYKQRKSYSHRGTLGVCLEDGKLFVEQYTEYYNNHQDIDPCWFYRKSTETEIKIFKRIRKLNKI